MPMQCQRTHTRPPASSPKSACRMVIPHRGAMCVRKRNFRIEARRSRPRYPAVVAQQEPVDPSTRVDPWLGTVTHVVASRQDRPNLPSSHCPFCPGGIEARAARRAARVVPGRSSTGGRRCRTGAARSSCTTANTSGRCGSSASTRCATSSTSGRSARGRSASDPTWRTCSCSRTAASEVGATIAHPHGQIYAYDHVPARPAALLDAGWRPDPAPGDRLVSEVGGWRAWVPHAPVHPISVTLAPSRQVPDLVALDDAGRDAMALALSDVLRRLDALFAKPLAADDVDQPTPDRRSTAAVARRLGQRRDRVALARRRARPLHRRGRARRGRDVRSGRARAARRPTPGASADPWTKAPCVRGHRVAST